jgi:uncharacterized membrane protein
MAEPRHRRGYLDWMRGLAVLIMIEAHVIDSWTGPPDRFTREFAWSMILGGFGAPLFLFLAGVSVVLAAGSKVRRSGDARAASRAVVRRGLEIFALAFLFRVQAWVLGWSDPRTLLKVDILNVMGPSIVAAAALWGALKSDRARSIAFIGVTLAIALVTPIIRIVSAIGSLPDPLEGYLRPVPSLTNFTFFPWSGFVFAGAIVGLLVNRTTARAQETRLNLWFGVAGAALATGAYAASWLPTLYPRSDFWTTSPSFFLLRVGVMTAAIALAYAWEMRPRITNAWSPMEQLGRTSLFIYWIHVEMVYGLISLRIHHALTLGQAWLALTVFAGFMLVCSIAKDRAVARWRTYRARRQTAALAPQ